MATLGSLVVEISADIARLRGDLGKAQASVDRTFAGISRAATTAGRALAGIGAVLGAGAFAGFVKGGLDAADTASKTAKAIGLSTEELSKFQYAAELGGASSDKFAAAMVKFSANIDKAATGQKVQIEQFERLGVTLKDSEGKLRPVSAVFADVADKIAAIPNGSEKTRVALELFGKSGAKLIPTLNEGSAGLRRMGDELEQFGGVISSEAAAASEQFNDNLARLGRLVDGARNGLVNTFAPGLSAVTDEFVRAIKEGDGFLRVLKAIPTAISRIASGSDQTQLAELELKRDEQQRTLDRVVAERGDPAAIRTLQSQIDKLDQRINGLKTVIPPELQGAAPAKPKDDKPTGALIELPDEEAEKARERERKKAEAARERAAKAAQRAAESAAEAEANYILRLREQVIVGEEATEVARARFDITEGEAKAFTEAGKQRIVTLAEEVDLQRESLEVQKELAKVSEEREKEAAQRSQRAAEERARTIESLRTPVEKYAAEVRRLVALDLGQENLQRGIAAARDALDAARDKAEQTNDVAKDLGLTFSSAFEDAIVNGKALSDVISGIEKDLLRLGTRKLVTEPLVNALDGFLKGGTGGGGIGGILGKLAGFLPGFATGGSFQVAGSGGVDSQIVAFRATPGEEVTIRNRGGSAGAPISVVINNPRDADSIMRSRGQIEAAVRLAVERGSRGT